MKTIIICVKNIEFKVYVKLLYEKGGNYWKTLFNSSMKMKELLNYKIVLNDFDLLTVKLYISYLDGLNIFRYITYDDIIELYKMAHYFDHDNLLIDCIRELVCEITFLDIVKINRLYRRIMLNIDKNDIFKLYIGNKLYNIVHYFDNCEVSDKYLLPIIDYIRHSHILKLIDLYYFHQNYLLSMFFKWIYLPHYTSKKNFDTIKYIVMGNDIVFLKI